MSDYLSPISRVEQTPGTGGTTPVEQTPGTQQTGYVQAQQQQQPKQTTSSKPSSSGPQWSDIRLKFQVDEKTNQVTVYVVDRESRRVLRTIPPSELNNLQAGDLIELLA